MDVLEAAWEQVGKRVYIPKADGKERPLGIPTLKDRVVQMADITVQKE